ncbi:MAG: secretion system protein E, partial [Desulfuromonadales bacterium]|nr:secretion system protein E [Desulfuromonadales bacterium]
MPRSTPSTSLSDTSLVVATAPGSPARKDAIAHLLVQQGLITKDQFIYAKRVQDKLVSSRSLIEVLKELKLLADEQLVDLLKNHPLDIRIGELLVELGHIRNDDLDTALTIQREAESRQKLGDILVEYGFIDERRIIEILASKLGYPFVIPEFAEIDRDLLQQVPQKVFSQHTFVPVAYQRGKILVAFADPLDLEAREAADQSFSKLVEPAIGPRQAIRETIELFRRGAQRGEVAEANDSTIIGIVNGLLDDAMYEQASDIHIEPMKDRLRIRFRCDGV